MPQTRYVLCNHAQLARSLREMTRFGRVFVSLSISLSELLVVEARDSIVLYQEPRQLLHDHAGAAGVFEGGQVEVTTYDRS